MTEIWVYSVGTALGSDEISVPLLVEEFGPVREDFLERTGFQRLYRTDASQTGLDLAVEAVGESDWWRSSVDALVYVSSTGNLVAPGNGHLLQSALGLTPDMLVIDINDACTGFVKALQLAASLLTSGAASTVLLVLSDTYSKLYDQSDLRLSPLFSDGASALLVSSNRLQGAPASSPPRHWRILSHRFISDGGKASELSISRLESHGIGRLEMNGGAVLNFVLKHLGSCLDELAGRANLSLDDVGRWYAHQGSKTVVGVVEKALGAEKGSLFRSADYGNTVGSSLPFQLASDSSESSRGKYIGLIAFGVGLTMAGMIVQQIAWDDE